MSMWNLPGLGRSIAHLFLVATVAYWGIELYAVFGARFLAFAGCAFALWRATWPYVKIAWRAILWFARREEHENELRQKLADVVVILQKLETAITQLGRKDDQNSADDTK